MGDVVFLVLGVVFFAAMTGLVTLLDRVIGPDETSDLVLGDDLESEVAA